MVGTCDMETKTDFCQVLMTPDGSIRGSEAGTFSPLELCQLLEEGGVAYFPKSPFSLSEADHQFLLAQRQLETAYHKNIAYRPIANKVTGAHFEDPRDLERLRQILEGYSQQVQSFLTEHLSPYNGHWKLDYASYRPVEEKERKLRLRARNDLLHVDSFPTRPTQGNRIFRVFTNINPNQGRVWQTSDTFEALVSQFKDAVKPFSPKDPVSLWKAIGQILGIKKAKRPPYDCWMLDFHNFLKENTPFQETARKDRWTFAPGSAWMVYTDMVSHSVLSGQYALEQTFIVHKDGLVLPEKSPIQILKRTYGAA